MLANSVGSTITCTSGESVAPMEETTDEALSITAHIYEEIISNRSSSLKSFKDFENYVKESTGSRFLQIQFKVNGYTFHRNDQNTKLFSTLAS